MIWNDIRMNIRKKAYDTQGSGFGPNGHRLFNPYNGQAIEVDAARARQLWSQYSNLPKQMSPDEYLSLTEMAEVERRKDDPEKADDYLDFAEHILGQDVEHLKQTRQFEQGQQTEQSQYASPSTIETGQPTASSRDWYKMSGKKEDKWKKTMSAIWADDSEVSKIHFINEAEEVLSPEQKKLLRQRLTSKHRAFRDCN